MINHLWQSTAFAVAAGLLTLGLRRNKAQVRYWLWFSASLKFLVPFSLLIGLGGHWATPVGKIAPAAVSIAIKQAAEPFPNMVVLTSAVSHRPDWTPVAMVVVWLCGLVAIETIRLRGWLRIRAAVRASVAMEIAAPVAIRSAPGLLEPGVVGMFRSVLLVPEGIAERLTPSQFDAVLAHEMCHIRRRDNLTSAIHMMVEALFWFHPLVWWIGARLVEERERACDEAVLSAGGEPHIYAEAILSVCKLYVESPLVCVSGVTGADLKKRIEAIMANRMGLRLNFAKKVALGVAGTAAVALPIFVGVMNPPRLRGQSTPAAQLVVEAPVMQPVAAPQIKSTNKPFVAALGSVTATTATVKSRVEGELMSVNFKEGELVQAGQLLASVDPRPYQVQLTAVEGQLERDQAQLIDAERVWKALPKEQRKTQMTTLALLEAGMKADQAKVDQAKLQLTYTRIAAPITDITGLRQVDPGNIVYSAADAAPVVIITQLQPIAVLFSIAEDNLPLVLARLKDGADLPVEAWNREFTAKYATGRLTAVDNQIDPETGTVKLKAVFDNKDGALFPNQFVNVRLLTGSKR